MIIILRIWNKLVNKLNRRLFTQVAKRIRDTAPVKEFGEDSGVAIISMVQKKDVDMYLLALKSFIRFLPAEKVIVVADPTIDQEDREVLSHHVPGITIVPAEKLRQPTTPIGGCWERFNALAAYNSEYYVIQLDADTIAHNPPSEVASAVRADVPFTLGTFQGQHLNTFSESASFAKRHIKGDKPHIQLLCESLLEEFGHEYKNLNRYVRACAGFTGFPKSTLNGDLIGSVSEWFEKQTEGRWREWGSEQFACNLMISNIKDVQILPIERYRTPNNEDFNRLSFLHFIGSMRFANSLYRKSAARVLGELS